MRRVVAAAYALGTAAIAVVLMSTQVNAWQCDFLTGGGFIYVNGAKGTFAIGGGCKHDEYWGHLEYHDHGTGLNAHWTSITAYQEWNSGTDDKGRLSGRRLICGTARTNQFGDVNFAVVATDNGEPGTNDEFDIQLKRSDGTIAYSTFGWDTSGGFPHKLGGDANGGGNIQLHKPNDSNTGSFGGSCPAL